MTAITEKFSITCGEIVLCCSIRRSARRTKTVAVTVSPAGEVLVIAPEGLSSCRVDEIVRRKAEWIVQRLRQVQKAGTPPSTREFVSGESVRYLGRHYRLKVRPNESGEVRLHGSWLHVPVPSDGQCAVHVRTSLTTWLRNRAAERLPERVQAWCARVGVPMPRVVIADQVKRWGSCDSSGTIRLNWRIVQAPMRLIDYVVVHELVHLQYRGHSPEFWQAVRRVMPDYERRREDLRQCGAALTW